VGECFGLRSIDHQLTTKRSESPPVAPPKWTSLSDPARFTNPAATHDTAWRVSLALVFMPRSSRGVIQQRRPGPISLVGAGLRQSRLERGQNRQTVIVIHPCWGLNASFLRSQ